MAEKQWPLEAAEVPDSYRPEVTEQQKREMRLLYAERSRRRIESLRLYEPLPFQEAFHARTTTRVCLA